MLEDILKQILSEVKTINRRIDDLEFNIGVIITDVKELKDKQQNQSKQDKIITELAYKFMENIKDK